jgi:L-threonylcarbamoyladenylate synthase
VEDLEGILGRVVLGGRAELLKRSPGTRYRHYSPKAKVMLVRQESQEEVVRLLEQQVKTGRKVGVMTCRPDLYRDRRGVVVAAMSQDLKEYARRMFAVLRELDEAGVDEIIVEEVEERGIGVAIMDRLRRAASANERPIKAVI